MQLKLDADGHVVVSEGKPVYIHSDGKELPFDAPQAVQTISARNAEAKNHREAKEAAEAKLKAFEGITDPEAAKKALTTVANLDAKKLVDAGDVERVKAEAIKAVEEKYAPVVSERDALKGELYSEKIGGSFLRSQYIAENVAIPADFLQARFSNNFKIEEGKIVPYDGAGNRIYSRANPGDVASFEEAIETLVTTHPQRDSMLKAKGSGTGAPANNSGSSSVRSMRTDDFNKLPAKERAAKMAAGITLTDA